MYGVGIRRNVFVSLPVGNETVTCGCFSGLKTWQLPYGLLN